jgi:superfamily I DNA/RNA helicase
MTMDGDEQLEEQPESTLAQDFGALLDGLNEDQRLAVTTVAGPVLILAGPGSGKTRVITVRIAYLIAMERVRPWHILAVTFTNKAAREMRERLETLVGQQAKELHVGTFHSICARVLRGEMETMDFGRTRNFTILDDDEQLVLIKQALKDLNFSERQFQPRMIKGVISRAKNDLLTPRQFAESANKYLDEIAARVYQRYEEQLRTQNAVDFDDLILLTHQLWRRNPEALMRAQNRYHYLHVDEFQDCNRAQYELVRLLALGLPPLDGKNDVAFTGRRNLCVVGDEDQCLVAGTQITMADGSQRRIEKIERGDQVLSAYGSGDFRPASVLSTAKRERTDEGIQITTRSGRTLISTPEHTHFAGYRLATMPPLETIQLSAESVRPGMVMFDEAGGYDIVERVERVPLHEPVYDLNIEGTHNFIANGLVTHNSIYAWRGASSKNILQFERDFPDRALIVLARNYRSTQTILDAAMHVVRHNPNRKDKQLWTTSGKGPLIEVREVYNEEEEGRFVADTVRLLQARGEAKLADCAVLYRTNAQSRAIEEQFLRAGVPYVVIGSRKFYERKEIRDVVAYLRLLANPRDVTSLKRIINVPSRKLGEVSVTQLLAWAEKQSLSPEEAIAVIDQHPTLGTAAKEALKQFGTLLNDLRVTVATIPLDAAIDRVLERTGYASEIRDGSEEGEERWRNVLELRRVASDYAEIDPQNALALFLENVALIGGADTTSTGAEDGKLATEPRDAVTLITLHAAKGLEFPYVFMVGMEEGVLPHSRSMESQEQLEEERRLAYVGITRAMKKLYLVRAFRRTFYGGNSNVQDPSRFLGDIPQHLINPETSSKSRSGATSGTASAGGTVSRTPSRPVGSGPAPFVPRGQRFPSVEPPRPSQPFPDEIEEPPPAPQPTPRVPVPGNTVRHRIFGKGVVLKVIAERDATTVEVLFERENIGRKTLDLNFARLEVIG